MSSSDDILSSEEPPKTSSLAEESGPCGAGLRLKVAARTGLLRGRKSDFSSGRASWKSSCELAFSSDLSTLLVLVLFLVPERSSFRRASSASTRPTQNGFLARTAWDFRSALEDLAFAGAPPPGIAMGAFAIRPPSLNSSVFGSS